jgi:hypothetical protein
MQIISQCSICEHFNAGNRERATCAAFPAGIPRSVWLNELDHRLPLAGDHGVWFKRDPRAPPE